MREGPHSATVVRVSEGKMTAREQYHRRIQQRQTVVFGSITAAMAVLLLVAMLMWSGVLPFPIKREFTAAPDPNRLITPCLSEDTQAVDLATVSANVYNSTSRSGIAAEAASQLSGIGVSIGSTDNWGAQSLQESARIQTGPSGIAAAYPQAQFIPGSVIQFDPDGTSDVLTVILGADWNGLLTAEAVAQENPDGVLTSREDCVPVEEASGN